MNCPTAKNPRAGLNLFGLVGDLQEEKPMLISITRNKAYTVGFTVLNIAVLIQRVN